MTRIFLPVAAAPVAQNPGEFLLASFGFAAGNTRAANAAAYTAAQSQAAPVRGLLRFPAGTFLMDPVVYDTRVSLKGLGYDSTVLDVPSGQYLFTSTGGDIEAAMVVQDMGFVGNGVGAGAFKTDPMAYFKFSRLKFKGFTNYALNFRQALIGSIEECWFRETAYGISNVEATSGDLANLVTLRNCAFQSVTKKSVYWRMASSIYITNSDFEGCGTNGDLTSGLITLENPSPLNEPIALVWEKRYAENNAGIGLDIIGGVGSTKIVLRDCPIWEYTNQLNKSDYHVRVSGNGGGTITLVLENSPLYGANNQDLAVTGNVNVVNILSPITKKSILSPATYLDYGTSAGGTTPTPPTPAHSYHFDGAAQQISAVNLDQLGFFAGQGSTIAFSATIETNSGNFYLSRGSDTVRTWDIGISYNSAASSLIGGIQLTDAGGLYLGAGVGYIPNTTGQALVVGTRYNFIARYTGGTTVDALNIVVNNSAAYYGNKQTTGFTGLPTAVPGVRIGRVVAQASTACSIGYLQFFNRYLTDAECTELNGNPLAPSPSFLSAAQARYFFNKNLLDETGNHNGSATSPVYQ